MKKILLIHTGGTFGMIPIQPSKSLAPGDIRSIIFQYLPEIQEIAHIEFYVAFNIDSANIQIKHWLELSTIICSNYDKYDGFVIIHGTDSMVYTACALSFILKGLAKPVILTGSQRPLALIRSDARNNLINSLELATFNIPEVSIFFGTNLYRGNRTIKMSSTKYEAFTSPNYPVLAEVGLDVSISGNVLPPGEKFLCEGNFNQHVLCLRFHPALDPGNIDYLIDSDVRAVVLEALGVGNLAVKDNSLIPWIKKMNNVGKIVAINSQSSFGRVNLNLYDSGKKVHDAGGISCEDMTTTASIVKLMYLLGRFQNQLEEVKHTFTKSLAGEITVTNDSS
jgi:L-asparaginase